MSNKRKCIRQTKKCTNSRCHHCGHVELKKQGDQMIKTPMDHCVLKNMKVNNKNTEKCRKWKVRNYAIQS